MIDFNKDCYSSILPTTKICIKCKKEKPLIEYNDTVVLSLRGDCKACEGIYNKVYYSANKDQIKANEKLRKERAKKNKKQSF